MEVDLQSCIEVLSQGGLILYPTDTIWGIGCDATNRDAVKKVYQLKRRDDNKALIVLLDSAEHLDHYVVNVPDMAHELIDVAVKPLTIIYEGAYNLAPNLLGAGDSVGIRARFGRPIVSTSANVSGAPSAATFHDISSEIRAGVDYVVKYRQDEATPHEASNIIMLSNDGTFKILR